MSGTELIGVVVTILTASLASAQSAERLDDTMELQVGIGALYGASDTPS